MLVEQKFYDKKFLLRAELSALVIFLLEFLNRMVTNMEKIFLTKFNAIQSRDFDKNDFFVKGQIK